MSTGKKIIFSFLFLSVAIGLWSFSNGDKYFQITKNLDVYAAVYAEINKYYVDEVNPNELIETSIDAMLKNLDPYTVYIPEDDIEDFRTNATGQYGGIGIQSNKINGKHLILNIYKDSPAFTVGLKIGDEIVSIDGASIIDLNDDDAGKLLKGQSDSELKIGVVRNQGIKKDFVLKREKIVIPNISYQTMLGQDVGYFRLSEFTRTAGEDVEKAVLDLKEQGAKNLIIDLRNNPGGLLNEAVDICNLFVPRGSKIVDTKGKTKAQSLYYVAKNVPLDLTIPIVVLIDEGSASASEIVSGVIQDYDRGVIVGKKSYGKGLVQVSRPLTYNSQLKVTTAKYYIPSGRCIQALDYLHKNEDGSAGQIPDSLKSAFKTTNGRVVFDGGGVDPDIKIKSDLSSTFAKKLQESGLIFEYATLYYYKHNEIAPPKEFALTDVEYQAFVKWMTNRTFENTSNVELAVSTLRTAAESDKAYNNLLEEVNNISKAIEIEKSKGLITFKEDVKFILEKEIVKRYYLSEGVLEASLNKDPYIEVGLNILADSARFNALLRN